MNRALTDAEKRLIQWMLEHGTPEAAAFLSQLDQAQATPWKCECGCASINLSIQGHPEPSGGIRPIAEFIFGPADNLNGIFVYEQSGILGGLEVYGLPGEAAKFLPTSDALRSMEEAIRQGTLD